MCISRVSRVGCGQIWGAGQLVSQLAQGKRKLEVRAKTLPEYYLLPDWCFKEGQAVLIEVCTRYLEAVFRVVLSTG